MWKGTTPIVKPSPESTSSLPSLDTLRPLIVIAGVYAILSFLLFDYVLDE